MFDFIQNLRKVLMSTSHMNNLDVNEVYAQVESGELILIDVRNADEWQALGMPEFSSGVSLSDDAFKEKICQCVNNNFSTSIAFICKSGQRSAKAVQLATRYGFTNVIQVIGGFEAWKKASLPVRY